MSSIEQLAQQRDYKRRRQTYRAKNVHITKRSTVEVRVKLHYCNLHTLGDIMWILPYCVYNIYIIYLSTNLI